MSVKGKKLLREHCFDESLGVKLLDVLRSFADTNEFHRRVGGFFDGYDYAAFGGAVELGQKDACQSEILFACRGFAKFLSLAECVLSGGGVEDQQDFVGSAGNLATGNGTDLG